MPTENDEAIWVNTDEALNGNGYQLMMAVDLVVFIYSHLGYIPADPTKWPALLPGDLHKSRRARKQLKRYYPKILKYFIRHNGRLFPDPQYLAITDPEHVQ
ncbi:MAG: hypothetical protein QNJ62_06705 [Methyloceanibacter sp.]|nr:hypothetical protein [Methyloceanibacter sp.]